MTRRKSGHHSILDLVAEIIALPFVLVMFLISTLID